MDVFDVEVMKYVLERMMAEANVEYWYHCPFTEPILQEDRVRGVIVESKSGREAVLAQVVIDCTGDGDVGAPRVCRSRWGEARTGCASR